MMIKGVIPLANSTSADGAGLVIANKKKAMEMTKILGAAMYVITKSLAIPDVHEVDDDDDDLWSSTTPVTHSDPTHIV